jgi:hypothetical protein
MPAEWKKGPLPPDTWNWGAVVTKETMNKGMFFAGFNGDHATREDGTRIDAADVLQYTNCIELPPKL